MLQAVLHGKAGRVEQDGHASISWRELFKTREDLLTAAVFSRFAYLSPPIHQELMGAWLGGNYDLGEFESIDFWPCYEIVKSGGFREVEPDLVMRFTRANGTPTGTGLVITHRIKIPKGPAH